MTDPTVLAKYGVRWRPELSKHFNLYYVPDMPIFQVWPSRGRAEPGPYPWLDRLKDDIAEKGFRQPLCIWGHHDKRGVLQPRWMVKVGANRLHCARRLGLPAVPAVISVARGDIDMPGSAIPLPKSELQGMFVEGYAWIDETGFGVVGVKLPEEEFAP